MGKGDTLAPEHTRSGGNGVDLGKVHLATAHEGMDIFIANGQLEIAGAPHCTRRVSAGRNAEVMIEP